MSETRFTPGPWAIAELDRRCVVGADGLVVADVRSWRDTDDAHLIAAALDMRAALVEAEAALSVKSSLRDVEQARVERALEVARAALARARGEEAGRG